MHTSKHAHMHAYTHMHPCALAPICASTVHAHAQKQMQRWLPPETLVHIFVIYYKLVPDGEILRPRHERWVGSSGRGSAGGERRVGVAAWPARLTTLVAAGLRDTTDLHG